MNNSFIYFVTHSQTNHVRVGFTTNLNRLNQHAQNGFSGDVAIVPAGYEEEQLTHKLLSKYLDRNFGNSGSTYVLHEELAAYISALLELGYATPKASEAALWPRLEFSVWKFGSIQGRTSGDGQISLWSSACPRDRIAYASRYAQLNSKGDEWYTPVDIIEKARCVMGDIDLDPSSSIHANRTVKAASFYTRAMNGLSPNLPWRGRVWLNPPYGRGPESAGSFIARLVNEYVAGHVTEAITCLNLNSMSSMWFRPLFQYASRHAIAYGRPDFVAPESCDDGGSPTKGTVFSYLGDGADAFNMAFGDIAVILRVENRIRAISERCR